VCFTSDLLTAYLMIMK